MTAILTTDSLRVVYGGVAALDGISMAIEPGTTVGLIGPNGAGKTTLFECIAGFTRPTEGTVTYDGEDVTLWGVEQRARSGLIRSFQDARLFASLTVFQALLVAQEKARPSRLAEAVLALPRTTRLERDRAARADELAEAMGLTVHRDKLISEISTGTRRIVELACVLALEPRLLLLDEPSSGIAQREVEELGGVLRRIRELTGATLLIIEHDMPLVMGLADRIVVLAAGQVIADNTPRMIRKDPAVIASYLGTTDAAIARSGKTTKRARKA